MLIGMIVSDPFVTWVEKSLLTMKDEGAIQLLFQGTISRTVAGWLFEYIRAYGKAPQRHIENIYATKMDAGKVLPDQEQPIAEFLQSISSEYERAPLFNDQYVIDQVMQLYRQRRLAKISEEVKALTSKGQIDQAESLVASYRSLDSALLDSSVEPLIEWKEIRDAFTRQFQPLFTYPGALGRMLNSSLVRDGLIGIMGPEKRGKTWWLLDFAMRALRGRCNVAFFQAGDMTTPEQILRICSYISMRPVAEKHAGDILVPVLDCYRNQTDECSLSMRTCRVGLLVDDEKMEFDEARNYRTCTACIKDRNKFQPAHWFERRAVQSLTWKEAVHHVKRFRTEMIGGKRFKLDSHSNGSLTVRKIRESLRDWERRDGFIPDVILVDYADILAPEDAGTRDKRHQIDDTWRALRALAQERHALVITATQATRGSYSARLITMEHTSEDKRKLAHVTNMIGLNQTSKEKSEGVMRLNQLVVRGDEFNSDHQVVVLQCFKVGRPYLNSYEYKERRS